MVYSDLESAIQVLLEKPGYRREFECKKVVPFFINTVGILKKVNPGKTKNNPFCDTDQ